jgi:hypothetical protein
MSGPTCHNHPTRIATWVLAIDGQVPLLACNLCAQTALESPAEVSLSHVPDHLSVIDLSEDELIDLVTTDEQDVPSPASHALSSSAKEGQPSND